jgi:hypothetical protein
MQNNLEQNDEFWNIKSDIVETREMLWKYYDRWPPTDDQNEAMYRRVCGLNQYMWWLLRHYKDDR